MKITSRQQQLIQDMVKKELSKATQLRTESYSSRRRLDEVGPDPMRVDQVTIEDAITSEIRDEAQMMVTDMMLKFNRKMRTIIADALNAHAMDAGVPLDADDVEELINSDDSADLGGDLEFEMADKLVEYSVTIAQTVRHLVDVNSDVPEPDWDEDGNQRPRGEEADAPSKKSGDGWYKGGSF